MKLKTCHFCKRELRATPDFFALTPKGRISSTCLECARKRKVVFGRKPAAELTVCPMCEELTYLVLDRKANARICRRCLVVCNTVEAVVKLPAQKFIDRLQQYLKWRAENVQRRSLRSPGGERAGLRG